MSCLPVYPPVCCDTVFGRNKILLPRCSTASLVFSRLNHVLKFRRSPQHVRQLQAEYLTVRDFWQISRCMSEMAQDLETFLLTMLLLNVHVYRTTWFPDDLGDPGDRCCRSTQHAMPHSEKSCQLLRRFTPTAQYPTSVYHTLVVALVLSRLDYGNAVLVGLPAYLYNRLQSVLNAAARSIAGLRRSDHITDTLASFHWLKVPERAYSV